MSDANEQHGTQPTAQDQPTAAEPEAVAETPEELLGTAAPAAFAEVARLRAAEDPPERPYDSTYAANDLLLGLRKRIAAVAPRAAGTALEAELRRADLRALHSLGVHHLETEELGAGDTFLTKLLEGLGVAPGSESVELGEDARALGCEALDALNRLGILWSGRGDQARAETYLRRAERVYEGLRQHPDPSHQAEGAVGGGVESLHTHTLFYLAQLFGNQGRTELVSGQPWDRLGPLLTGHPMQSAEYCYQTLKRQLLEGKYDGSEWASNCAGMAVYYRSQRMRRAALECIDMAGTVLPATADASLRADLALSRGRILLDVLAEGAEERETPSLRGTRGPDASPRVWEGRVQCPAVPETPRTMEEARAVFLEVKRNLDKGAEYYVLDGYVTDHLNIAQDLSKAWSSLAAFETSSSRRCKMHKRRADLFEPFAAQLNPRFFHWQLQHVFYRLGEVYSEMAELKVADRDALAAAHAPEHVLAAREAKVNKLIDKSLKYHERFQETFKGEGSEEQEAENRSALMTSHFTVARLCSKRAHGGREEAVAWLRRALAEYAWICDYGARHADHGFDRELALCNQMLELLPQKINDLLH
eukprot:m51a1_g4367 hypothetical protein (591) ;mRNA; r:297513-299600